MNFIISANTDVGTSKQNNQDSISVLSLDTPKGKMAFAVLCDGMGGLEKGEVASASVVRAFRNWAISRLPTLCQSQITDNIIRKEWEGIVQRQNDIIKRYGLIHRVQMGTTVVVMLLTQSRYYVLNVGDSRAYELTNSIHQLTNDHTLVAREVALGNLTVEAAMNDARRSVLLQCVGASESVYPDMFFGDVKSPASYMLCSDGFRHEVTPEEIFYKMRPDVLNSENDMLVNTTELIELNKQRQERDNISALLIRTY